MFCAGRGMRVARAELPRVYPPTFCARRPQPSLHNGALLYPLLPLRVLRRVHRLLPLAGRAPDPRNGRPAI